jgi:diguanylate cyclase (GGDEF)-like protein
LDKRKENRQKYFMKELFKYLDKIPKPVIFVISITLVVLLGVVDYLTGYEIAFSIFYLQPVSLVSWFGKRSYAIIICILSAIAWVLADIYAGNHYSNSFIPLWNGLIRLGFFLITSLSLLELKGFLENEQKYGRMDFLTGVANRRAFYELATMEINRAVRFNRPLTMAYIDIDNFKHVNDTRGHIEGDNLLQSVARTIRNNTRSIDIISRLGGDEFAVLFPETNETNAKTAIAKVQKALLDFVQNNNWPVTFSIGAVTCYKACHFDELIKEADDLMYAVKKSGKNKIEYKTHNPQQE